MIIAGHQPEDFAVMHGGRGRSAMFFHFFNKSWQTTDNLLKFTSYLMEQIETRKMRACIEQHEKDVNDLRQLRDYIIGILDGNEEEKGKVCNVVVTDIKWDNPEGKPKTILLLGISACESRVDSSAVIDLLIDQYDEEVKDLNLKFVHQHSSDGLKLKGIDEIIVAKDKVS